MKKTATTLLGIKLTFLLGVKELLFDPADFKITKEAWYQENYYKHFHVTGLIAAACVPLFLWIFDLYGSNWGAYFGAAGTISILGLIGNYVREREMSRKSMRIDGVSNFSETDCRVGFYGAVLYSMASAATTVFIYNLFFAGK